MNKKQKSVEFDGLYEFFKSMGLVVNLMFVATFIAGIAHAVCCNLVSLSIAFVVGLTTMLLAAYRIEKSR